MVNLSRFFMGEEEAAVRLAVEEPEEEDFPEDSEESPASDKYDEDGDSEEDEYALRFDMRLDGLYILEKDGGVELRYDDVEWQDQLLNVKRAEQFREDIESLTEREDPAPEIEVSYKHEISLFNYEHAKAPALPDLDARENERIGFNSGVLNIEYESPELLNGQATYQRIVFRADREGESVYEMTMRKFMEAGVEVKSEYDPEFESMLLTSVNKKEEGADGNFNEFYLNGEIGNDAVDKQLLMAGDVVEWRYAEETDGSCGGVPDFQRIKQMLNKYDGQSPQNVQPGFYENDLFNPFFAPDLKRQYLFAA